MQHDAHERILSLAKSALEAEESPLWGTDIEQAAEIHAERCDALWQELYRQVRETEADNISTMPSRGELERQWKKEFVGRLRKNLPKLVSEAIEMEWQD